MDNEILYDVVRKAEKLGADQAEVLLVENKTVSVATRLAKLERIIQADVMNVKMRVSIGKKNATISTDNLKELQEDYFVEKAIFAAENAPEDSLKFRPQFSELCRNFKKIDICDNAEISSEKLIEDAKKCESIALQINGITNSEGSEASHSYSKITLVKNNVFIGEYEKTSNQISIVTIGTKNGNLERDYDFSKTIYYSDLKSAEQIAKTAAEKTIKKLGARKIQSCKVPVVFDKRVSSQLLKSLLNALNGAAVAKGISFLKDKLFQKVFNNSINVIDRYAIDRGLRSRPFDSDGLECFDNFIIQKGEIKTFLLNTKYANQLNMKSTGNAFGFEGISPNNICIENGKKTFQELMGNIKKGIYVTEVLGNGLNCITGNYSQGAVGFWIEDGQISYPVNEITIAGNFIDMFANCEVASDLQIDIGIDSPTLFMEEIVVGGI